MSLRSIGSLLSRRFSPRAIPRAHAPAPAKTLWPPAGRPARSLHSLRDLAAGNGAYTGAAAAALVFGFLYVMKGSDDSAGEVTGEEIRKGFLAEEEEARKQGNMVEAAAVKEDSDSGFSLENYLAEMTELAAEQKKARHEREVTRQKAAKEVTSSEAMKEEDVKEEAAMKARFEEWIKEYGRRYRSEEEKARRYELFKAFAKMVDKATAQSSGGAVFVTNHTADWTEEECRCLYDNDVDWDDYLDHIRSLIDKKNAKAKKAIRD